MQHIGIVKTVFRQSAPMVVTEGVAKAVAEQQNDGSRLAALCAIAVCPLLVHGSLVVGNCCQHIGHDAAWANCVHPHIVWRQSQSHTPTWYAALHAQLKYISSPSIHKQATISGLAFQLYVAAETN